MRSSGLLAVACLAIRVAAAADGGDPPASEAPEGKASSYVQTAVIEASPDRGRILGLCVASTGGLVAVTGTSDRYGTPPRGNADEPPPHALVWFAADGTEARAVDLGFPATVTCAAPDGGVLAAGDGVVVRLSPEGREVARGATPTGPKTDEEREQFARSITERHEAQVAAYEAQIERMREAVAELERKAGQAEEAAKAAAAETEDGKTEGGEPTEDAEERRQAERRRQAVLRQARSQAARMAAQLKQMEGQVDRLRKQDVDLLVEQALRKPRQVRAISATRDAVFLVTPEPVGFGYAVWRLDAGLGNAEKVVSGLRGCCGQMDAQVFGERLAIAVNTKHCVELLTFAGEPVGSVGHRAGAGDDPAGFGGCCNPMNTCTAPDGSLLTSESNGVVKRFDAEGTFTGVVGRAEVKGGCKNSAIAIEPDGSRLYYLDVVRGSVLVLTPETDVKQDDAGRDS